MIVTHTDFTKVTRMVLPSSISEPSIVSLSCILAHCLRHRLFTSRFHHLTHLVEVSPVVMLTTCETTTTGMLSVLADSTVTGRDVPTVLAGVGESSRHLDKGSGGVQKIVRSGTAKTRERDFSAIFRRGRILFWRKLCSVLTRARFETEKTDFFQTRAKNLPRSRSRVESPWISKAVVH